MIKIAICDDNLPELRQIQKMVGCYLREHPEYAFRVSAFSSPERLLDQLQKESYHIYLLDIIMAVMNGIEIGRLIRKTDRRAAIIYLTSSPDYAVASYTVGAYYYLLKPIEEEKLLPVLERAIGDFQDQNDSLFQVPTRKGLVSVFANQIMYVEYHNHIVTYHLQDGRQIDSTTIRVSFDSVIKPLLLLPASPYAKISSSFLVNLNHVSDIYKNGFLMPDGAGLTITRPYSEARHRYMELILKGVRQHDL